MIANAIHHNHSLAVRYRRREKRSMNHSQDSRFLRYFAFGSMAAMLQIATLTTLVEVGRLDTVIASTLAFYIAVVVNYFLQRRYTFRSFEPHWIAMPKFVGVSTVGAVINVLVFTLLTNVMHYLIAQLISLLIVFSINYCASSVLIFGRKGR
jgi:putative flippase GtrA